MSDETAIEGTLLEQLIVYREGDEFPWMLLKRKDPRTRGNLEDLAEAMMLRDGVVLDRFVWVDVERGEEVRRAILFQGTLVSPTLERWWAHQPPILTPN